MGKGKQPPKGAGGRGYQLLPSLRGGGVELAADARRRRRQEPQLVESGGLGGSRPHSDPLRAKRITVGTAKHIIGPAHEVLSGLAIPSDLSEAHRDLFLELLRTIEDLQQSLARLNDETRALFDENEELRKKIDDALPLWKRAWETFVLKGAETAGQGVVFIAGFVAGAAYREFAAELPGIPV